MLFKIVMLATLYLKRGRGSPQSLKLWMVDFGPITSCLNHRVTTRTYVYIRPWRQDAEVTRVPV